ncbi:MAG TPA: hypothetical protein PLH57_06145, partial [Oligoflexia bacterium]|nr:hypothetical protein [Oligoflexia bacterium]
ISVKDLAVSKIPIIVVSSTENGPIFERQGNPIEILRGALGLPNIIETIKVGGLTRSNAAFEIPFPSDYARDLGYGKTLCIDVVGRGNNFTPKENYEHQIAAQMRTVAALSKEQLKACDEVVRIPTDGIGYFDFEQKAELIFRGKAGVQKWLATKK